MNISSYNSFTVLISPLNSIWWFSNSYQKSNSKLFDIIKEELRLDSIVKIDLDSIKLNEKIKVLLKPIITLVPYVKKEFFSIMKERNVKIKLFAKSFEEYEIIEFICNFLNLDEFFNLKEDIILSDSIQLSKHVKHIIISESIEDLIQLGQSGHHIRTIFNHLITKDSVDYIELHQKNCKLLKENQNLFKPDLMIESLRQSNELIFFLNQNIDSSPEEYFKSAFNVLYMLDPGSASKNYRKRELAVSTQKIRFTPLNKNMEIDEESLGKYGVFLQRCPYFYLNNKAFCYKIEEKLKENKSLIFMHNFKFLDAFFNRFYVYKFLSNFVTHIKDSFYAKYKINLQVPYSIPFSIDEDITYDINDKTKVDQIPTLKSIKNGLLQFLVNNSDLLKYPVIIKPDSCTEHEMFLILSQEGIETFANEINLEKLLRMRNFIVQRFIPHGGLMFKNYYINRKSFTIVRPSLPNLEGKILDSKRFENKCFSFHNEFLYSKEDPTLWEETEKASVDNNCPLESEINKEALDEISQSFVRETTVSLFGLDYLFDKANNTYYLLEVNYFPSYRELGSKLPEEFAEHIIDYYHSNKN